MLSKTKQIIKWMDGTVDNALGIWHRVTETLYRMASKYLSAYPETVE